MYIQRLMYMIKKDNSLSDHFKLSPLYQILKPTHRETSDLLKKVYSCIMGYFCQLVGVSVSHLRLWRVGDISRMLRSACEQTAATEIMTHPSSFRDLVLDHVCALLPKKYLIIGKKPTHIQLKEHTMFHVKL
uniref:Uncharacterized protein n=1 Tax=Anguilla anguilla TaxID=7936 RepID=A0A0E9X048_ANGAN